MRQFIQLENGSPKQYPIGAMDAHRYAPENTGFPLDCTDADLSEFGFETFVLTDAPSFDPATQRVQAAMPVQINGVWSQAWEVVALTAEEIAARQPKPDPRIARLQAAGFNDAQITAILSMGI